MRTTLLPPRDPTQETTLVKAAVPNTRQPEDNRRGPISPKQWEVYAQPCTGRSEQVFAHRAGPNSTWVNVHEPYSPTSPITNDDGTAIPPTAPELVITHLPVAHSTATDPADVVAIRIERTGARVDFFLVNPSHTDTLRTGEIALNAGGVKYTGVIELEGRTGFVSVMVKDGQTVLHTSDATRLSFLGKHTLSSFGRYEGDVASLQRKQSGDTRNAFVAAAGAVPPPGFHAHGSSTGSSKGGSGHFIRVSAADGITSRMFPLTQHTLEGGANVSVFETWKDHGLQYGRGYDASGAGGVGGETDFVELVNYPKRAPLGRLRFEVIDAPTARVLLSHPGKVKVGPTPDCYHNQYRDTRDLDPLHDVRTRAAWPQGPEPAFDPRECNGLLEDVKEVTVSAVAGLRNPATDWCFEPLTAAWTPTRSPCASGTHDCAILTHTCVPNATDASRWCCEPRTRAENGTRVCVASPATAARCPIAVNPDKPDSNTGTTNGTNPDKPDSSNGGGGGGGGDGDGGDGGSRVNKTNGAANSGRSRYGEKRGLYMVQAVV